MPNRMVEKKSVQIQDADAKSDRKSPSTFFDFALNVHIAKLSAYRLPSLFPSRMPR